MVINLKDLKHLEIVANLESNEAPPKPTLDVKALFETQKKNLNFNDKILSLCSKLRAHGFDKQASKLEDKFIIFKQANVHLYRVFDEDGEDVINFAHPDGENEIAEADKDLGVVETILTKHKKIVDIVNKTPTGKISKIDKTDKIASGFNTTQPMVILQRIADKFKYMEFYLDEHVLKFAASSPDKTTTETTIPGGYYARANQLRELALLIARELNSPARVPEKDAVQLVKNRMSNSGHAAQAAQTINSYNDIDVWIRKVLAWFDANNPNNKKAHLNKYMNQCLDILKNSQHLYTGIKEFIKLPETYQMLFGNAFEQAQIIKEKIFSILRKPEVSRSAKKLELFNNFIGSLNSFIAHSQDITNAQADHINKNELEFIKKQMLSLQKIIPTIKIELSNLHNIYENDATSKLYNLLVKSDYVEASNAVSVFDKSVSKLQVEIGGLSTSDTTTPSEVNFEFDELKNKPQESVQTQESFKAQELAKLQNWKNLLSKKELDSERKQHINEWLDGQIKELQDAKTNEQINKIISEDKEFAAQGII